MIQHDLQAYNVEKLLKATCKDRKLVHSVPVLYLLFGSISIGCQLLLQCLQLLDPMQRSLLNRHKLCEVLTHDMKGTAKRLKSLQAWFHALASIFTDELHICIG